MSIKYSKISKKSILVIVLIALSLTTHFIFFGHPDEVVFDEVHFGKFVSGYYTHEFFFDIHPPLGKLMIAGFAKVFDFQPQYTFEKIGNQFDDLGYLSLRFLPSLAGALLPLAVLFLALGIGIPFAPAYLAAIFIALEGAMIVQSRFVLIDAFLLLFGMLGLGFYLRYRSGNSRKMLFLMSIFLGLAISVKWTGVAFLGLAGLFELVRYIKKREWHIQHLAHIFYFFIIVPFLIYYLIFLVHLQILDKSGSGNGHMSQQFQKTLSNNAYKNDELIIPSTVNEKFIELNIRMFVANKNLNSPHSGSSSWYGWPLMVKPIYYWVSQPDISPPQRIYLIGNPIIWYTATAAVITLIISLMFGLIPRRSFTPWFLLVGYASNMLPFIGISRVMFLYHYFSANIFAILTLAYLITKFPKNYQKVILWLMTILAGIVFLYFAPFTYGLGLSDVEYNSYPLIQKWQ